MRRNDKGISTQINMNGCTPSNVLAYLHTLSIVQMELSKLVLERFGTKISDVDRLEVRKSED